MGVSKVRNYLEQFGCQDDIIEFDSSSATVELAAAEVGTEPARIAKTMAFLDGGEGGAILVVAAGDARVHSGTFKRHFGFKARMVPAEQLPELTGHPVGGVCPFANPIGTRVYLDESLKRFSSVWPAAGTANSAIEMTPADLERISGALGWVEVTRGWQPETD